MNNKQGLTLISAVVAMGLMGVIVAAGMKLINNQVTLTKQIEVTDRRSAIVKFYSDLLRDANVWDCTLKHTTNSNLKDYVVNLSTLTINGNVALIAPDCSTVLVGAAGKKLGNSSAAADANGWWTVKITWQGMGKGAVDLKLTVSLDRTQFNHLHGFQLDQPLQDQMFKVRRSENAVQGNSCKGTDYEEAVTGINLHTASANRRVNCSGNDYRIVQVGDAANTNCTSPHVIKNITAKGEVVCSTDIAVKPSPSDNSPITGLDPDGNFTRDPTKIFIEGKDCGTGNAVDYIDAQGKIHCASNPKGPEGEQGCDWPLTRVYGGDPSIYGTCACGSGEGGLCVCSLVGCPYRNDCSGSCVATGDTGVTGLNVGTCECIGTVCDSFPKVKVMCDPARCSSDCPTSSSCPCS